jgi:hypothetical protein
MSHGPGRVQRLVISRLRRAGAPMTTVALAGAVYGGIPSAAQISVVLRALDRLAGTKKPKVKALPKTRPRTWEATITTRPKSRGREDLPGQLELETGGIGTFDGSKLKPRR